MNKKVILVSGGTREINAQPAFVINASYLTAIGAQGAVPVMVGLTECFEDYADLADGLLITGGESVHPRYFGETFEHLSGGNHDLKHAMQQGCNVRRDELEMALFHEFVKRGKPVMGICRGHQLINAATGGKNQLNFPAVNHQVEHHMGVCHEVVAEEDSVLGRLFGTRFMINSYHQDCAVEPGPDMRVTARGLDGMIEALESKTLPIITFQFHPERMRGDLRNPALGPVTDRLFQYFIEMC